MITHHHGSYQLQYISLDDNTDNGFDLYAKCCIVDSSCMDDIEFSVELTVGKIPKKIKKKNKLNCNQLKPSNLLHILFLIRRRDPSK